MNAGRKTSGAVCTGKPSFARALPPISMSQEGLGASAGPQAPRWPPRRLHGKMLACNIPVKASLGCDVPREGGKGPGEMRGAAERHGRWLQERVSSRRRGARMDKYGLLARRQRQAPGGPLRATCALGGAEGKADPRRDPGRLREERPPRGWRCEGRSVQRGLLPAEGGLMGVNCVLPRVGVRLRGLREGRGRWS